MAICAHLYRHTGVSTTRSTAGIHQMCRWHPGLQACTKEELDGLHKLLASHHQTKVSDMAVLIVFGPHNSQY